MLINNNNELSIFIMIHGEKQLHELIIKNNEKKLNNVILIGNSLLNYFEKNENKKNSLENFDVN